MSQLIQECMGGRGGGGRGWEPERKKNELIVPINC